MKAYKYILVAVVVCLFVSNDIQAQAIHKSDSTTTIANQTITKNTPLWSYKRIGFSVDMGVGVYGSKHNSGSYTYVAPFMSYRFSPKFRLDVGGIYQQAFGGFNNYQGFGLGGNGGNLMLFARGNYLVNDRLIISGAVYKTFDTNKPTNTELINKKNSFDNYGVSVAVDFKITEHLTIGAQINYSNGNNNPFYQSQNNPYQGGYQTGINTGYPNRTGFMGW